MAGYGTDDALNGWLTANGHALPEGAPSPAILRQRASDYIDATYEADFIGIRTAGVDQERAWPRTGAVAFGQAIASDAIPGAVERASYVAALHEAQNPGSLSAAASQAAVIKREKIGPIETEYATGSGDAAADAAVRLTIVEGMLSSLLRQDTGSIGVWAVG